MHGGDDQVVCHKVVIPQYAIGHIVGKSGRNIKQLREMPGVRRAFLNSSSSPAMLSIEVSRTASDEVLRFVQEKVEAGQRAQGVITRRWAAVQGASCSATVVVPSHLVGYVVQNN